MNCELFLGRVIFIHLLTLAAMGVVFPLKHGTVRGSSDVNAAPKNGLFLGQQLIPNKKSVHLKHLPTKCVSNLPKHKIILNKNTQIPKTSTILFWNLVFSKTPPLGPVGLRGHLAQHLWWRSTGAVGENASAQRCGTAAASGLGRRLQLWGCVATAAKETTVTWALV